MDSHRRAPTGLTTTHKAHYTKCYSLQSQSEDQPTKNLPPTFPRGTYAALANCKASPIFSTETTNSRTDSGDPAGYRANR